jgi:hypothetical protein
MDFHLLTGVAAVNFIAWIICDIIETRTMNRD